MKFVGLSENEGSLSFPGDSAAVNCTTFLFPNHQKTLRVLGKYQLRKSTRKFSRVSRTQQSL
jgi:hypothetical protein